MCAPYMAGNTWAVAYIELGANYSTSVTEAQPQTRVKVGHKCFS